MMNTNISTLLTQLNFFILPIFYILKNKNGLNTLVNVITVYNGFHEHSFRNSQIPPTRLPHYLTLQLHWFCSTSPPTFQHLLYTVLSPHFISFPYLFLYLLHILSCLYALPCIPTPYLLQPFTMPTYSYQLPYFSVLSITNWTYVPAIHPIFPNRPR